MSVTIVTDNTFGQDVLKADRPVLVDFFAQWCGPCKHMTPTIDAFASANKDVLVVKVDVDEAPQTAGEYGLRGVPTLMIFERGQKIASHTGAISEKRLSEWFRESVGATAE